MGPDLRTSRPLSSGPTLFLASATTAWRGRHFLNGLSPAARSGANAGADPAISTQAMAKVFVMLSSVMGRLMVWKWRPGTTVSMTNWMGAAMRGRGGQDGHGGPHQRGPR